MKNASHERLQAKEKLQGTRGKGLIKRTQLPVANKPRQAVKEVMEMVVLQGEREMHEGKKRPVLRKDYHGHSAQIDRSECAWFGDVITVASLLMMRHLFF